MCQDEECQEELQELRADIVAKQKKVGCLGVVGRLLNKVLYAIIVHRMAKKLFNNIFYTVLIHLLTRNCLETT